MGNSSEYLGQDSFPYEKFFVMEKELPAEICDQIVSGYENHGRWIESVVDEGKLNRQVRKSKNQWLADNGGEHAWLADALWKHLPSANSTCGWDFDIRGLQDVQMTKYDVGEYYDFHLDGNPGYEEGMASHDRNMMLQGCIRKISVVILLSDDFEGGKFEFTSYAKGNSQIIDLNLTKKGTIVFFPSFLEHRVTPVTEGVRHSAVGWFTGPPLR